MGVYSKSEAYVPDLKRNAYDGSHQNNLTGRLGYLIPCLCMETLPGDTFRINAAYGLRFMPTAFPLQTKLKAHVDFFYVRDRNLWKGWKNYITGIGPHDGFPVLSREEKLKQIQTGVLGDYLGLPSTICGKGTIAGYGSFFAPYGSRISSPSNIAPNSIFHIHIGPNSSGRTLNNTTHGTSSPLFIALTTYQQFGSSPLQVDLASLPTAVYSDGDVLPYIPFSTGTTTLYNLVHGSFSDTYGRSGYKCYCAFFNPNDMSSDSLGIDCYNTTYDLDKLASDVLKFENGRVYIDYRGTSIDPSLPYLICLYLMSDDSSRFCEIPYLFSPENVLNKYQVYTNSDFPMFSVVIGDNSTILEASNVLSDVPFDISALPFRAYEQIYNSFYRDSRNNPLYVDGVFDPNRFLPNDKGGEDSTPYRLYKRNWEQDFLTTALTSPQYGPAPLVGLTSSGVATFADVDGNLVTSKLSVDDDGDTVVGFSTTRDSNVNQTLVKLASSGISINDLRGVNSLQRYLEAKYRIGLRYKDQIKAHTGVTIAEDVLDMPEFIGSITQTVDVSQINQTSPNGDDPLGSYAGQLSCVGGRENGFQKYCDEHGYIIGILSVVPVPCYSQLLPKYFLKTYENLDYFSPEFNHLGFQPIKYNEVCPFQALSNGVNLNSTFGYQRAWYDYLQFTDEVHGQFRTTLNNFLMCRVFETVPSLNPDFLTVDPDSINDVFTVNEVNGEPVDTFLGQIHFDITMMRQISRFGTPRLE